MGIFDYQASLEITFDKEITSNPEVVTGTEYFRAVPSDLTSAQVPLSSGDNSSYPKDRAFDGSTSTYWRSSSTTAGQWIGRDFGSAITLTKIVARFDYSSGRPNAYQLQGSDDGSTWADVATGNFANASGDQEVTFSATTYRYWRLYFSSRHSSYYTCSEFSFYNARNVYNTTGWTVTGAEYLHTPSGAPVDGPYLIRKITKSVDNLNIKLWLDMSDRMRDPAGDVTVSYDGLAGNLRGQSDSIVESFQISCTPQNIVPIPNPYAAENIEMSDINTTATLTKIYYTDSQGFENIEIADINTTASLIHIDDL